MKPLQQLKTITDTLPLSEKMPVLFLGHGSPMNAIEDNEFTQSFKHIGQNLPTPKAMCYWRKKHKNY